MATMRVMLFDVFLSPWQRQTARLALLGLFFALALIGQPAPVLGQSQLAAISGIVTEDETGKPLSSVTVVINGPALQEFQAEVTDANGRYIITQLPPGDDYQVSFYFGADDKPRLIRPGIRLSLGKTVNVSVPLRISTSRSEVKVIRETAPNIDTATANTGVELNQEILTNTPVRGRTFESVLALAPGAADIAPRRFSTTGNAALPGNDVGVSISGSTGAENNYIIDGISTSDPAFGIVGTELSQYFIKEINIITGGYQAEFGRATGGVATITTKSGGNEFHGSVFGTIQPYQLTPVSVARLGESIATRTKTHTLFDFGFELGGYLLKDHIWFYVGLAPTFTNQQVERRIRTLVPDGMGGALRDPNYQCPGYLGSSLYCAGPSQNALATTDINEGGANILRQKRLYNYIAKFQFNINPDHNITIGYIGSPITYDDTADSGYFNIESQRYTRVDQVHDVSARYIGKLLKRQLQLDVLYGYHYQSLAETPVHNGQVTDQRIQWNGKYSLADFEDVPSCERMGSFNPCPLTLYIDGLGFFRPIQVLQRHSLLASATAFVHFTQKWNPLRGVHAIKVGFDFEQIFTELGHSYTGNDYNPNDPTSGHRSYFIQAGAGGAPQIGGQLFSRNVAGCKNPLSSDPSICLLDSFRSLTQTRNFSVYLRDSWQVDWVPGLVLNLGVRWEGQEIYGMALNNPDPTNPQIGEKVISIYDNWAPRIGLAYDFTQLTKRPGRGKLFFNYARFYESIPTDINNRQFTGEGSYVSDIAQCAPSPRGPVSPRSADCQYPLGQAYGGAYSTVAPGLKGQYINEFVLGANYDVGYDFILGVSYIHRDLGSIIEDVSPDGANYAIANPGYNPDPKLGASLTEEVTRLQQAATANPGDSKIAADLTKAQNNLDAFKLQQQVGAVYPRATRDYNALMLTLQKRLSNRFSIISSYTYSRTIGNYPGTFNPTSGQLDPNISTQFDLADLLANRNGPLPNDRPHNFKATGFYDQPIGDKGKLTFGLTFTALSGRPIEVLGAHFFYGIHEVFILPRGSGGRTPTVTQFDLHLGYEHKLGRIMKLNVFADILNLLNQRTPTNVDDDYTYDAVPAITNGQPDDLRRLRNFFGTLPTFNPNYGQPVDYQAPLALRFGARLSF